MGGGRRCGEKIEGRFGGRRKDCVVCVETGCDEQRRLAGEDAFILWFA